MFLVALIVVLLILVVWFGSTSYAPKALLAYFYLSFMPLPQMQSAIDSSTVSLWQIALNGSKKEFVEKITMELADLKAVSTSAQPANVQPVAPAVTVPPVAPSPVPSPAPAPTVGTANATPTPVVEKFRTNMAHMYGSEHA